MCDSALPRLHHEPRVYIVMIPPSMFSLECRCESQMNLEIVILQCAENGGREECSVKDRS